MSTTYRQDAEQMQHHTDLVWVLKVVVALSWQSTRSSASWIAEDAIEREVFEAGQSEAKDVPDCDEPWQQLELEAP